MMCLGAYWQRAVVVGSRSELLYSRYRRQRRVLALVVYSTGTEKPIYLYSYRSISRYR